MEAAVEGRDGGGASGFMDGGADSSSSLFEGMILFDSSSDLLPAASSPSAPVATPPSAISDADDVGAASTAPSAPAAASSQPLDEDLFSDLTILIPSTPSPPAPSHSAPLASPSSSSEPLARPPSAAPFHLPATPPGPAATPETPPLAAPVRQISRKKKRAIKIGYARGPAVGWLGSSATNAPAEDEPDVEPSPLSLPASDLCGQQHYQRDLSPGSFPSSLQLDSPSPSPSQSGSTAIPAAMETRPDVVVSGNSDDSGDEVGGIVKEEDERPSEAGRGGEEKRQKHTAAPPEQEENEEDAVISNEVKLDKIRAQVSDKLSGIKDAIALLLAESKELRRRRRKAADSVNAVSVKYKELESQLEEACELEDFERAERVSQSLAAAEKEKDDLLRALRGAEEDCDTLDLKMQEALEMQISAEEECVVLLEQFSKSASDGAELIMRNAAEAFSKEMEEWNSALENLEARKLEMGIESQVVNVAHAGLANSIEHLTEDDRKEKEMLTRKGDLLAKELGELLALVKQKEAQIAENDAQIQEVEERISKVASEFQETQSTINAKCNDLQLALSGIESEGEGLFRKKKEIDESFSLAERKSSKLKDLACASVEEAKTCHDLVALRKRMASCILKSREDKVRLAKLEEKILEEIQVLRQQISSARSSLQELSSTRASIQEKNALLKQRINFIDKRGPELEAEKKVAAAARNFKEAGRIAAEAKALSSEKESVQLEGERCVSDLEKVEEEIRNVTSRIQESEELILSKEKEAAIAGCERLHLVAATARAERAAAIESGDNEESDILLLEVEAADAKARQLQQRYEFELDALATVPKCLLSIPIITNLSRETASSYSLPLAGGS